MSAALKQCLLNWILGASLWRQRGRGIQDGPLQVWNGLAKSNWDKKNKLNILQIRRARTHNLSSGSQSVAASIWVTSRLIIPNWTKNRKISKIKHKKGKQSIGVFHSFLIMPSHLINYTYMLVNLSTGGPEFLNKTLRSYQFWKTDTDLFMHVSNPT